MPPAALFRALKGNRPSRDDFRSDREANRPYVAPEPWIEHNGISVYASVDAALAIAVRWPVVVAELLVDDPRCSLAKTGPPGHFTLWGPATTILRSVAALHRQTHPEMPPDPVAP